MYFDLFKNDDTLLPAIIQDHQTHKVLMLGYFNKASLKITLDTKKVTFFSRSRQSLWTKGETSGHFLNLISLAVDCDNDTFLVKVTPTGPVCHTGQDTCWNEKNDSQAPFYKQLEAIIQDRKTNTQTKSYVKSLFDKGTHKIAQKVGEEAVELVIEAMRDDPQLFLDEASDLFFHYLILLKDRGLSLDDIQQNLRSRHLKSQQHGAQ